jgi:hypothetical protein
MGTATDNHRKRGRTTARRAKGKAKGMRAEAASGIKRVVGQARKVSARSTRSIAAYARGKRVKALAIAAASVALLHAAIKVLTPTRH